MPYNMYGYNFEGAFVDPSDLEIESGVYLIHCKADDKWYVLDVGESQNVRERVMTHDREDCWKTNCRGGVIHYSAHYMPNSTETERVLVEQTIRQQANPICGER